MEKIDNLIARLTQFEQNRNHYIEEAIKQNEKIVVEMNVMQMYDLGQLRTGKSITPPYSEAYKKVKQGKGQITDHVTLRDTGAFHDSLGIEYFGDGFKLNATDWKTQYLVNRYTDQIFGLKDEVMKEICDQFVTPYLRQQLNTLLQ